MQAMESGHRAVGFAPEFPFVGEVTVPVADGGYVVVKEGGYSAAGAVARARAAARSRFSSRARRAGFYSGGFEFKPASYSAAGFAVGFAS